MSTPITPLADRIVAVREEAKTQTASGIYLPDSSKEKPVIAEVKAVRSDVKNVKVSDKIIYEGKIMIRPDQGLVNNYQLKTVNQD